MVRGITMLIIGVFFGWLVGTLVGLFIAVNLQPGVLGAILIGLVCSGLGCLLGIVVALFIGDGTD